MLVGDADQMAAQGMRVLGVAKAVLTGDPPGSQQDIAFGFLGLVGLADPVRRACPRRCASAARRVFVSS